jgi:exosortase/archaeosortase family protein
VAAFLGWGVALAFFQWATERSFPVLWLTEHLTGALAYMVKSLTKQPIYADGMVVKLSGVTVEVTPACFGLAAVTVYLAAVLATPAGWRDRLRGVGLGLVAIALANAARLAVLTVFFMYAFAAFGFVHIPVWGTVVPLFLVGVWGFWLVRDLHSLPRFPLKFFGLVALFLVLLFTAWYVILDRYVMALVLAVNAAASGLAGVPIETLRLTSADLFRYLDVGLPAGGFRVELAGQTLSLVPCLALILASPLALGRRLLLAVYGVALLFVLQGGAIGVLITLGWSAPRLVAVFQIVNDFFSLAAGPTLWLLLSRPSAAWFSRPAGERPSALGAIATPAGGRSRRR